MITISKHYCDDCIDTCWFAHDHATSETLHVDDLTAYTTRLQRAGYYYASHVAGDLHYKAGYRLAAITPLPLDWQMSLEDHVHVHDLEVDF